MAPVGKNTDALLWWPWGTLAWGSSPWRREFWERFHTLLPNWKKELVILCLFLLHICILQEQFTQICTFWLDIQINVHFVCAGSSFDPQTMFHNAASNIICIVLFGSRYDYDDEFLKLFIHLYTENAKLANGPWAMVRHFISSSFKWLYSKLLKYIFREVQKSETTFNLNFYYYLINVFFIYMYKRVRVMLYDIQRKQKSVVSLVLFWTFY